MAIYLAGVYLASRSYSSPSSPPTGPDLPAALARPCEKFLFVFLSRKNLAEAASDLCWEGGGEKSGATIPTRPAKG